MDLINEGGRGLVDCCCGCFDGEIEGLLAFSTTGGSFCLLGLVPVVIEEVSIVLLKYLRASKRCCDEGMGIDGNGWRQSDQILVFGYAGLTRRSVGYDRE